MSIPRSVTLIDPFDSGHHVPYARELARGLSAQGVAVFLVGGAGMVAAVGNAAPLAGSRVLSIYDGEIADYHLLPAARKEPLNLRFLRRAFGFAQEAGSEAAHLLYLDRFILPLWAGFGAARGLNVQATLHWASFLPRFGGGTGRLGRSGAERWALAGLLRRGLTLQLHSPEVAALMPPGRVGFVPYPSPLPPADPAQGQLLRLELGLGREDRLLLAFGGTRHDKGADLAVQLLARLPQHVHLLVIGRAEHFSAGELSRLAAADGTSSRLHLRLEGFIPEERAGTLFLACDAALLPYRRNFAGQSGPLTIAAALGVPVAAADAGSMREMVQEYSLGEVFPSEDLTHMARAAEVAVALPHRPPHHPEVRRFIQDHSPGSFVRAVLRSYDLSRPPPASLPPSVPQEPRPMPDHPDLPTPADRLHPEGGSR